MSVVGATTPPARLLPEAGGQEAQRVQRLLAALPQCAEKRGVDGASWGRFCAGDTTP